MKNIQSSIKNKKKYTTPRLKTLGNVTKLTLKAGSQSDAFGGTYAP